ncbi:hypothetical protein SAMN05892883_0503 [Jatrophihabitans sp. GAS493]|nr:hypothetical protein SAMN05892883_0503 [Jatrophihabitans sp. GAS493]
MGVSAEAPIGPPDPKDRAGATSSASISAHPSGLASATPTFGHSTRWAAKLQADSVRAAERCPDVARVLPGGVSAPSNIREAALSAALRDFDELRRLDMGSLAQTLGVSRSTLYRQAGDRDNLLGQAIWWRSRMSYALVLEETAELTGLERLNAAIGTVVRRYQGTPQIRRFIDEEPQAAMRILTGPTGQIQRGFITVTRNLLELEIEKDDLHFSIPPATLAYAIVRLIESFMYSDVLAVRDPDIEVGIEVVRSLLAGALTPRQT